VGSAKVSRGGAPILSTIGDDGVDAPLLTASQCAKVAMFTHPTKTKRASMKKVSIVGLDRKRPTLGVRGLRSSRA
jgi:hypothetical protein